MSRTNPRDVYERSVIRVRRGIDLHGLEIEIATTRMPIHKGCETELPPEVR